VAGGALGAGRIRLVVMVRRRVVAAGRRREGGIGVGLGSVALQAGAIARQAQGAAVRLVAVGAADATGVHAALAIRTVDEHLVVLLAIGVIQAGGEQAGQVVVEQGLAGNGRGREFGPACVAGRAQLHLLPAGGGVRAGQQPLAQARHIRRGALRGARGCPLHVRLPRSVAGLAGDVRLLPARVEAVVRGVVALFVGGDVAGQAHRVGSLVATGPVQHVAGRGLFVGKEVEPAPGVHVPGHLQGLQAPAGAGQQVLLQRCRAEGVQDVEIGRPTVGAVGVDTPALAFAEEARGHAAVGEAGVGEVAGHGVGGRRRHGAGVV
jgi:hypothetical protein